MAFRRATKTKKWQKSRLNLHVTISEGKSIGSNPKKRSKNESSRRAQAELKVCLLMILQLMIQAAN
jgi:hypothetical protein